MFFSERGNGGGEEKVGEEAQGFEGLEFLSPEKEGFELQHSIESSDLQLGNVHICLL